MTDLHWHYLTIKHNIQVCLKTLFACVDTHPPPPGPRTERVYEHTKVKMRHYVSFLFIQCLFYLDSTVVPYFHVESRNVFQCVMCDLTDVDTSI
jgi:hypothetical protein